MFLPDYTSITATGTRSGPARRLVVLVQGPNPTVEYYFSRRLEGLNHVTVKMTTNPASVGLEDGDYLLACRYLPPRWWRFLHKPSVRLAGAGIFFDDDYVAMVRDRNLPMHYRAHIFGSGLFPLRTFRQRWTDVFVSTEELADRFAGAHPKLFPPIPRERDFGVAAQRDVKGRGRVAFHAQLSHIKDHELAASVWSAVCARTETYELDVIGPKVLAGVWRGLPNVRFRSELDWQAYEATTAAEGADLLIAPLFDTVLNRARASTKAIDAVRMRAAALFPMLEPYACLQDIAPMLGDRPDDWAQEIITIMQDGARRRQLAEDLRQRVSQWRDRGRNPLADLFESVT